MSNFSLEEIKREAFERAGRKPVAVKTAAFEVTEIQELIGRLQSSGQVKTGSDDGVLYMYANMYKEAQRKAGKRLGLVNGRISLR
jgi:hypothetical protein